MSAATAATICAFASPALKTDMKKILSALFVLFILWVPTGAHAAIAFDNATRSLPATGATATFSHVVTGSNPTLVVYSNIQVDNTLTATYDGVSMTQVLKQATGFGTNFLYGFVLINPHTGTHNVVLTSGAGAGTNWSAQMALSYTGTNQSTQPDSFNGATQNVTGAADSTVATTVILPNSWLVFAEFPTDADPVSVVGGTSRLTGNGAAADSNGTVSTGSQSVGFHWNVSDRHALGIMSISPTAAAPTFQLWKLWVF